MPDISIMPDALADCAAAAICPDDDDDDEAMYAGGACIIPDAAIAG
jgi:hypothetical protein